MTTTTEIQQLILENRRYKAKLRPIKRTESNSATISRLYVVERYHDELLKASSKIYKLNKSQLVRAAIEQVYS